MNRLRLFTVFIFIVSSLTLSLISNANSQSLGIGIKVGPNLTSHLNNFRYVSGDVNLELTPNISSGQNFGFVYRQQVSKNYHLQLEPSIMTMGAKYDEGFELRGFDFHTVSETELKYIQLPLLLQWTITPPVKTANKRHYTNRTFHLSGGVFGSYLLDAQFSGTNSGAPIGIEFTGNFNNDIKDQYSDYDAGFMLGVGIENGSSFRVGLEARLMLSVIDSGDTYNYTFKPKNMGAIVSLYLLL